MPLTPAERSLRARTAAHKLYSLVDARVHTEPGRAAFMARFEKEVDPEGVLSPAERARRAEHARKSYFAAMALKSSKARRARAGPLGENGREIPWPPNIEAIGDEGNAAKLVRLLGYGEEDWRRTMASTRNLLAMPSVRKAQRAIADSLLALGALQGFELSRAVHEAVGDLREAAALDVLIHSHPELQEK